MELIIEMVLEVIVAVVSEFNYRWLKLSLITISVLAILGLVVYLIVA